jgi:hypothetical protein
VATLFSVVTEVLLLPAAIPAIAQQKQRSPFMKVPFRKLFSVVILAAFSLALAACGGNSAPSSFTISGTVVNLAGTDGGLVLQDNLNDPLPVNANGSFTFAKTVASGSPYSVTISTQPSNPTQTCGVTNGSGVATANVTNLQVNCGHNEWTWAKGPDTTSGPGVYGTLGVPSDGNNPGPRQNPATWTDASGNFWLFGGYDFSGGTYFLMNDLWEFSAGEWTWMGGPNVGGQSGTYGSLGVPAMANIPGGRYQAVTWTDASGNFWLFGGIGFDSAGNQGTLNDLWKYSAGEWTWVIGSNLYDQQGTYGTLGVPAANNIPGSRAQAVSWIDSSGNFWLFGGINYNLNSSIGQFNDLWKFSNGEWTWVSGSNVVNQHGIYGTLGIPAPGNVPGARNSSVSWIDSSGNLWLFGGSGYISSGPSGGLLNDLWEYSNGQWTWMSGFSGNLQSGLYSTKGTPAAGNTPGARQTAISWTDSSGNFWLFGGIGPDSVGNQGALNDLWKYSNGEWTWMSGSNLINQNGVYGTQGIIAPGNIPGARTSMSGWIDPNGNLWFFGGFGVAGGGEGDLSDLWMYMP